MFKDILQRIKARFKWKGVFYKIFRERGYNLFRFKMLILRKIEYIIILVKIFH